MAKIGIKPKPPRHFIKQWRIHRGLTQDQLADRVGYDRTHVSKIEKGKRRYDQPFLEAVAEALNCTPADLIMRDPTAPGALWSIWDQIAPVDRPKAEEVATKVLEAFKKKTGTDG